MVVELCTLHLAASVLPNHFVEQHVLEVLLQDKSADVLKNSIQSIEVNVKTNELLNELFVYIEQA